MVGKKSRSGLRLGPANGKNDDLLLGRTPRKKQMMLIIIRNPSAKAARQHEWTLKARGATVDPKFIGIKTVPKMGLKNCSLS